MRFQLQRALNQMHMRMLVAHMLKSHGARRFVLLSNDRGIEQWSNWSKVNTNTTIE